MSFLEKCMVEWACEIEFACNFEASQQRTIIAEKKEGNVTVVLRGGNERYFIEVYEGKTMYPAVYKVFYNAEEEYQRWAAKNFDENGNYKP